ncbi:MAG TPA: hypothetical protein P5325_02295 [Candidatus Woesebacteria bacterium]|nr:hypothetical protein [Candidatus Woesebacteria bacterium]
MSKEIRREMPFPRPSGREMPLPSDMDNGTREVVEQALGLWEEIFKNKINFDREKTTVMVNEFYEGLGEEERQWLEGDDPQYRRPRGAMIKERAMQMVQIEETPLSKRQHRGKGLKR